MDLSIALTSKLGRYGNPVAEVSDAAEVGACADCPAAEKLIASIRITKQASRELPRNVIVFVPLRTGYQTSIASDLTTNLRAPIVGSCITIGSGVLPLPKFEECLQRLEKIVQELEKGDAPLEKSLTLFEEGMQLSSACRKELEQAEGKVEILLKQNGKLQAVAFEPEAEKLPARR
jgi:exodeoxyribonuclease VII small subunit